VAILVQRPPVTMIASFLIFLKRPPVTFQFRFSEAVFLHFLGGEQHPVQVVFPVTRLSGDDDCKFFDFLEAASGDLSISLFRDSFLHFFWAGNSTQSRWRSPSPACAVTMIASF
jgi:hypothetical protein